jgi:dTDP-glucose pyrophosphorylase
MIKNIIINITDYLNDSEVLLSTCSELKNRGYILYAIGNDSLKDLNREIKTINCDMFFESIYTTNINCIKEYYFEIINHVISNDKNIISNDMSSILTIQKDYNNIKIAERLGLKICFLKNICVDSILKTIIYYQDENKTMGTKTLFQKSVNIVIPIMGDNRRFLTSNYRMERNLINVMNKHFLFWVTSNLQIDGNYIFIIREHLCRIHKFDDILKSMYPNCIIIKSEQKTQGNVCSILLAEQYINNDNPLIIANDNQWLQWNVKEYLIDFILKQTSLLQIISFNPYGNNNFDYIKTDNEDQNIVKQISLKQPISEHALTEVYFWRYGKDFVKYAHRMNSQNKRYIGEFCTTLVTNELFDDISSNKIPNGSVTHKPVKKYFIFNEAHHVTEFETWYKEKQLPEYTHTNY